MRRRVTLIDPGPPGDRIRRWLLGIAALLVLAGAVYGHAHGY